MEGGHNETGGIDDREQLRIEFYATYDVMTGIRIAATLGGFFGLMVFLVIYKSRSKSVKALKDPKIAEMAAAAVAEEEAEEEERQLAFALEAAFGARYSLGGSMGAPRPRATRFSSVGGYSSLLNPPRRLTKLRTDSLPASALHFYSPAFYEDDIEIADQVDDSSCTAPSEYVNKFLAVPGGSRRYSNITCSSSGSSYLERRGSSIVCALPTLPPTPRPVRTHNSRRYTLHTTDPWESNPIDIQVIQATPELSPCVSENTILDCGSAVYSKKTSQQANANPVVADARKLAPLASLGSCGASLSVDYQDYDLHSVGSDSVFMDEEEFLDTDDEIEQFSTDSDESVNYKNKRCPSEETRELRPRRRSRHIVGRSIPVASSPPLSASSTLLSHGSRSPLVRKHHSFLSRPITRRTLRRLSHPTIIARQGCSTISATVAATGRAEPSSISEEPPNETYSKVTNKVFGSLPFHKKDRDDTSRVARLERLRHSKSQDVELGCGGSSAVITELTSQSPSPLNPEHCSWSQETLF
ncbi:uncharacterized protein LOC143915924 [Arctopsyche grandis]|uniref:uncharacterized protein LOC143915924 n=1 Tax=Arctopsyche grandis TaxID=121162 RepID=UPI00406DA088